VADAFDAFVRERAYPCVMAKSVHRLGQYELRTYPSIRSEAAALGLARDLAAYARAAEPERGFRSFVATFEGDAPRSEEAFEEALWGLLGRLHERDASPWDPAVSSDPREAAFSFSFAGRAFYVVGMHPEASRPARRFATPLIAFNLNAQFEQLREEQRYVKVRDLVRQRDRAYAGSVNPMMNDFGAQSEARQYSGRSVGEDWVCPFSAAPRGSRALGEHDEASAGSADAA
jgi:FPC/CPF motif-containing protein YcgG